MRTDKYLVNVPGFSCLLEWQMFPSATFAFYDLAYITVAIATTNIAQKPVHSFLPLTTLTLLPFQAGEQRKTPLDILLLFYEILYFPGFILTLSAAAVNTATNFYTRFKLFPG